MSDPRTKAERSRAKDLRQGIVEQRPVSASKVKKRKWLLMGRWIFPFRNDGNEITLGRYPSAGAAKMAKDAAAAKGYYTDLRIEPPDEAKLTKTQSI